MRSTNIRISSAGYQAANTIMSTGASDKRIVFADALRFIAISAVVISHLSSTTNISLVGHGHGFTWLGIWGVDCFFVLTGFLLSQRFIEAYLGKKPFPSLKEYFLRRLFRIYPLYLCALLISVSVAAASGTAPSLLDVLAHLALIHGFFPQYIATFNSPLWTMAVDAQFYCVLPLFAIAACRLTADLCETRRIRLAWKCLGLIIIASVTERFLALLLPHPHHLDWPHYAVYVRNILGLGGDFATGSALALFGLCKPKQKLSARCCFAIFGLGLLFFVAVARAPLETTNTFWFLVSNSVDDLFGGFSAAAFIFAALHRDNKWLVKIAGSPFIRRGASLAYGIYLFHDILIDRARQIYYGSLSSPASAIAFSLVILLPVIMLAMLAHRFIEIPGLRLRDGLRESTPGLP